MANQPNLYLSKYPGGANVVDRVLRLRVGYALTQSQAEQLWACCRLRLLERNLPETVGEAEVSKDGTLDTLPREDVLEAIALELTGSRWPLGLDTADFTKKFAEAFHAEAARRQYAVVKV